MVSFLNKAGDVLDTPLSSVVTEAWLRKTLIPIITKKTKVSIRLIDWLCTNYSKQHQVSYHWKDEKKGISRIFNIHSEYKQTLKSKSRKMFDPFRRGERIFFELDDTSYETTMGQILFFLWADRFKVLTFLTENAKAVEEHMAEMQERGKKRRRVTKQRAALSTEPSAPMVLFSSKCTFSFDE